MRVLPHWTPSCNAPHSFLLPQKIHIVSGKRYICTQLSIWYNVIQRTSQLSIYLFLRGYWNNFKFLGRGTIFWRASALGYVSGLFVKHWSIRVKNCLENLEASTSTEVPYLRNIGPKHSEKTLKAIRPGSLKKLKTFVWTGNPLISWNQTRHDLKIFFSPQ